MSYPNQQYYDQAAMQQQYAALPYYQYYNGYALPQYYAAQPGMQTQPVQQSYASGWLAFSQPVYVKGLIVGAGIALLASNSTVQRTVVAATVRVWESVSGGMEEIKEQVRDIRAESAMGDDV
jgi:hypothetical protein